MFPAKAAARRAAGETAMEEARRLLALRPRIEEQVKRSSSPPSRKHEGGDPGLRDHWFP
jgi:hypothetical protein